MTFSTEIQAYWQQFCQASGTDPETPYGAFAFGNTEAMADELAHLVLQGKKTGTSSGYELYFLPGETETVPQIGQIDVVLDGCEQPVCVVQNIAVTVLPFKEVSDEHARKEGEGDLSLDYWRRVHIEFFKPYYAEVNLEFSEETQVLYEEFKVIYPN